MDWRITSGWNERERAVVTALLREYESAIGVSLCFQGFQAEVEGLPGEYAAPRGALLLARPPSGEEPLGCVALRPVPNAPDRCEMKRLYVRAASQGTGLGRALAEAAIEEARRLGYGRICLDTLPSMVAAQGLYNALGFTQTGTAGSNPAVLLFERDLKAAP